MSWGDRPRDAEVLFCFYVIDLCPTEALTQRCLGLKIFTNLSHALKIISRKLHKRMMANKVRADLKLNGLKAGSIDQPRNLLPLTVSLILAKYWLALDNLSRQEARDIFNVISVNTQNVSRLLSVFDKPLEIEQAAVNSIVLYILQSNW